MPDVRTQQARERAEAVKRLADQCRAYSIVMDDALKDAKDGTCPPRQYAKKATWLIFTSSNGNDYKFRKDSVIGWGSASR